MYPATLEFSDFMLPSAKEAMPPERTSDVPTAPIINYLMLTVWAVFCLIGFGVIFLAHQPVAGALIVGVPTFLGMVLKPTFALCMLMLVLPTGAGVGLAQALSLDRAVGLAVAIGFFMNVMITRPGLRIQHRVIWVMMAYSVWIAFASLAGPYLGEELVRAFTQVQLLALMLIVYWILETNTAATFIWALRSYVVGSLGTIALAIVTGASIRASSQTGDARFSATLGNAIDANMLAALTSTAFLAAVYLMARDRSWFWRFVYLAGIVFLPIMLLRIGSRGALVALAFTVVSPLFFVRQILRRPALAALLLVVILLGSASALWLIKSGGLDSQVSQRLSDIGYAGDSIQVRLEPIYASLKVVMRRPIGSSVSGWFEQSGQPMYPHNDFFFMLGIYGFPGAALFALLILMMMWVVRSTPLGIEKLYSRALLTFLVVMGLNIGQVYKKYFWVSLALVLAAERLGHFHQAIDDRLLTYEEKKTVETTNDLSYGA